MEAKDSNNKTHQGSNTQADDDRFSIVVARERENIEIRNMPIKTWHHVYVKIFHLNSFFDITQYTVQVWQSGNMKPQNMQNRFNICC